jgi:hypothetical protein
MILDFEVFETTLQALCGIEVGGFVILIKQLFKGQQVFILQALFAYLCMYYSQLCWVVP